MVVLQNWYNKSQDTKNLIFCYSSTNNPSSNHEDATGQMTPSRPPPPLTPINGLASTSLVNG